VKTPFPLDKHAWHPSLLAGQIVLVTTLDERGLPNVAPKSWVTMVAFDGPVLGFGCNVGHATYRNAVAGGEFVVNVVPAAIAEEVWALIQRHGVMRVEESELTLVPATAVRPPIVAECRAHLECRLDDVKRYGDEVFVFGRVVAASIDDDCLLGGSDDQYGRLDPVFFLEAGTFARLEAPRHITRKETAT